MANVVTIEKLTHLFIVDRHRLPEAVAFYRQVFQAEQVESFYCADRGLRLWVELKVSNANIVVCTSDTLCDVRAAFGTPTGKILELETVDVNSSLAAAIKAGAVVQNNISEVEQLRGVKAKVQDRFGFIWSLTEKRELPVRFVNCPLIRPFLFPAIECEVEWWIASRKFGAHGLGDALNIDQLMGLQACEFCMDRLEKSLLELKFQTFFYKKNKEFFSHPSFSDILSELVRVNGILQGVQILFFMNRKIKTQISFNKLNQTVQKKYDVLSHSLPPITCHPSNWPNLITERRDLACAVRQLLKGLLRARRTIYIKNNEENTENVIKILEQELVTDGMIRVELSSWRVQDMTV